MQIKLDLKSTITILLLAFSAIHVAISTIGINNYKGTSSKSKNALIAFQIINVLVLSGILLQNLFKFTNSLNQSISKPVANFANQNKLATFILFILYTSINLSNTILSKKSFNNLDESLSCEQKLNQKFVNVSTIVYSSSSALLLAFFLLQFSSKSKSQAKYERYVDLQKRSNNYGY